MKKLMVIVLGLLLTAAPAFAAKKATQKEMKPLIFGVGMFQPNKEKNDETYKPLAAYLSKKLHRDVTLKTVETWEGLAKALANGEADLALMGPWGYVLANNEAGAQVVATILYDGKPEYFAIMITNPKTGIKSIDDMKGHTFSFADKGSTSGYLIPFHHFMKTGIDPEKYFSKVMYSEHPAIEMAVTRGEVDAGADYNRNRNTMIEQGLIKAEDSKVVWTSDPLPNDAFGVSADLYKDKKFVAELQKALVSVGRALGKDKSLLPPHYGGFVEKDNSFYKPVRDAGLATGKLTPKS